MYEKVRCVVRKFQSMRDAGSSPSASFLIISTTTFVKIYQTLFPLPGLKTKEGGHSLFFMYPARYFPAKTTTQEIIDNLAYCMNTMCDTNEKDASEGIGFLAYMNDWKVRIKRRILSETITTRARKCCGVMTSILTFARTNSSSCSPRG